MHVIFTVTCRKHERTTHFITSFTNVSALSDAPPALFTNFFQQTAFCTANHVVIHCKCALNAEGSARLLLVFYVLTRAALCSSTLATVKNRMGAHSLLGGVRRSCWDACEVPCSTPGGSHDGVRKAAIRSGSCGTDAAHLWYIKLGKHFFLLCPLCLHLPADTLHRLPQA